MSVTFDITRTIPPELQLPVPRQVRRRAGKEAKGLGCIYVGLVALAIVVAYMAWVWFGEVTSAQPSVSNLVVLTIGGVFAGGIWWLFFSSVISGPYIQRKLLRSGKAVTGKVIRKHRKEHKWISSDSSTWHVDYEFDHPGLGRRTGSMSIEKDEWNALAEGAQFTVLCYPHRGRPTVLYDHCLFECVPAAGGPSVMQPARLEIEESEPIDNQDQEYVFPPELQRPAPRRAIRRQGTLQVGTVIGRVFWCGIALIGLYTLVRVPIYWLVACRGEVIDGTVDSTTVNKSRHTLHYSFDVDGKRQEDSRGVDITLAGQLRHGQKIPVLVRSFAGVPYSVVLFEGERPFSGVFDAIFIALDLEFDAHAGGGVSGLA